MMWIPSSALTSDMTCDLHFCCMLIRLKFQLSDIENKSKCSNSKFRWSCGILINSSPLFRLSKYGRLVGIMSPDTHLNVNNETYVNGSIDHGESKMLVFSHANSHEQRICGKSLKYGCFLPSLIYLWECAHVKTSATWFTMLKAIIGISSVPYRRSFVHRTMGENSNQSDMFAQTEKKRGVDKDTTTPSEYGLWALRLHLTWLVICIFLHVDRLKFE